MNTNFNNCHTTTHNNTKMTTILATQKQRTCCKGCPKSSIGSKRPHLKLKISKFPELAKNASYETPKVFNKPLYLFSSSSST